MPSDFTPPSEELKRLAQEISLLRRDFQAGTAALGRIEKRLKATFPTYPQVKQQQGFAKVPGIQPNSAKNRDGLMADFESLLVATKEKGDVGFESYMSGLPEHDVIALAHELGVGSSKAKNSKKAREGIRKRVQESLLLSFDNKNNS